MAPRGSSAGGATHAASRDALALPLPSTPRLLLPTNTTRDATFVSHVSRVEQTTNNNAQHRDLHRDCGTLSSSHIYSSGQRQAHTAGSGRSTAQAHRQTWVSQPGGYAPSSNSGELQIFQELTREHQASCWTSSEGVRTAHTSIPTPLGWSQQKSRCPWGPDAATAAILSMSPSSPRGAATHQGILPCGHHRRCHRSPAWGPSPWEASCSLT